jgi:hypothetical protein
MDMSGQPNDPAVLLPIPIRKEIVWAPEPVWTWRRNAMVDTEIGYEDVNWTDLAQDRVRC